VAVLVRLVAVLAVAVLVCGRFGRNSSGRVISCVCVPVCPCCKRKRLELSTQKSTLWCMVGVRDAVTRDVQS